jgi:hypothetical protein
MNDDGKSLFTQHIEEPKKERPEPEIPRGPMLRPVIPPVDIKSPPIERLIAWLVLRWPKPTVYSRDILQYGPNPLRNRKSARASAELLVKHGWLTPLKTRRSIDHEWRIERGPNRSE